MAQATYRVIGVMSGTSLDGVDLAQGQLEMISVVQNVHEIRVEGMDVLELRKFGDDGRQFVVVILLSVFDLQMQGMSVGG